MMLVAVTREISPAFNRCELTHLERQLIDVDRAREQHRAYEQRLREFGCRLETLPAEPDFPDSVFVEDVAVVLDEMAVITRPGALSRRGERASIVGPLEKHRHLAHIQAPGVIDGGDVLQVGRRLYVGLSQRTNPSSIEQLRGFVEPSGYSVSAVPLRGCLHLKSAASRVADETLLINPEWVEAANFDGLRLLAVDREEPMAANALQVGSQVMFPAQYPRTLSRLERAGIEARPIEVSELLKAEAGVTCCSLVFSAEGPHEGADS